MAAPLPAAEARWLASRAELSDLPLPSEPPDLAALLRAHSEDLADFAGLERCSNDRVREHAHRALPRLVQLQRALDQATSPVARATLAVALWNTCQSLLLRRDAARVASHYGLCDEGEEESSSRPEHDEAAEVDLAFFPVRIDCDETTLERVPPPSVAWYVRPRAELGMPEFRDVAPDMIAVFDDQAMRGSLSVLVFRAPKVLPTRVGPCEWLGMVRNSCILLSAHVSRRAHLQRMAEEATETYGATWVWVHAEADSLRSDVRDLRADRRSLLAVPTGGALVLQRVRFRWTLNVHRRVSRRK